MLRPPCPPPSPPSAAAPAIAGERAQAALEFVGLLPVYALLLAASIQAFLVACALPMVELAAQRSAAGASRAEALAPLPESWRTRADVKATGTATTVTIEVPAVVPLPGPGIEVAGSARGPE